MNMKTAFENPRVVAFQAEVRALVAENPRRPFISATRGVIETELGGWKCPETNHFCPMLVIHLDDAPTGIHGLN